MKRGCLEGPAGSWPRASFTVRLALGVLGPWRSPARAWELAYEPRPLTRFELDRRRRVVDSYVEQLGRVAGYPERRFLTVREDSYDVPSLTINEMR